MKRLLAMLLILTLSVAILSGCGSTVNTESTTNTDIENVIKIGILEPLSGENSAGGKQEMLGVAYGNIVQPTVTIGGETYRVELVAADSESSVESAVTAAQSLVEQGASVILGDYSSASAIAASSTIRDAGLPAVGISCTNPAITAGNDHYFRVCWLDTFQGVALANFAREQLNATTAYCLVKQGDDYSMGLGTYFAQAFINAGGSVIYEAFPEGTTDFSAYLAAAKHEGADVFFAPVSTEAGAWLLDQAAAAKLEMPVLGGDSWDSSVISAVSGKGKLDIYITAFFDEHADTENGAAFVEGFKQFVQNSDVARNYNGNKDVVSANSAMGYDAYFTVLAAMEKASSADPKAIQEALWDVSYEGITGKIEFEQENGDAIRDTAYIKKANNEFGTWDFFAIQTIS